MYILKEMAYPQSFSFEEFDSITSYSKKIKYADQHLQKISSGSSRVIFKIDDDKVLKVAKNVKGLAQNSVERDAMIQQWYDDIVAKVFKIGEEVKNVGPFYLEMELAKRISPKRFENILKFSVDDLKLFLTRQAFLHHKTKYNPRIDDEKLEYIMENPFVVDLWDMIQNFDMEYPGDFGRINTYGEVIRNGIPKVVLIDYGLSEQVWVDYYKKN